MNDSEASDSQRGSRHWQGGVYRLGDEPPDDLSRHTTPEQRLALLTRLTERAWTLTGAPFHWYQRLDIPAKVIRPS